MQSARPSVHEKLSLGSIVLIRVDDVDRAKIDPTQIVGCVVEVTEKGSHRVATIHGVLKTTYCLSDLMYQKESTLEMHDLEKVMVDWKTMPRISLTTAAKKRSVVGGQGYLRCKCKTQCKSAKCSCKKAGVKCNSRCHSSLACCNK